MSPVGRSQDVDAIVDVIQNAEKFVHISVMDYIPLSLYTPKPKYDYKKYRLIFIFIFIHNLLISVIHSCTDFSNNEHFQILACY